MRNILITGGTGFIGKHLVSRLLKEGYNIFLLTRRDLQIKGVKIIKGDLTQPLKIPKNIDTVFHLAALTNSSKTGKQAYEDFRKINLQGTINLVESLKNVRVRKFIFFSSVDALGLIQNKVLNEETKSEAKTPYDISKYEAEQYLLDKYKKDNFPSIILRPTMVYGEGELSNQMKVNVAVFNMCKLVKKHIFPTIGNGKNLLPLVYVGNIVNGVILAEKYGKPGEIYTLSDERSYSLNEVVRTIAKIQNINYPGPHIPKSLMKISASLFEILEKIGINAPIKRSGVNYITQNRSFDISKAKKEFNYKPIDLMQGIEKTINWFKLKKYL